MSAYPLQGRVLFITGGGSGIGAETARQAAKRGARLAIVDVNGEAAEEIAGSLPNAIAIEADVRDYDALVAAAEKTAETYGGIDIAFANAGIEVDGTALGVAVDDFERLADVNFTGVFKTVKATLPYVIDRRGYVLITASLAAFLHAPPLAHYTASKAGVEAFGNALRIELMHKGVDVGVAYFAIIDTPMAEKGMAEPILEEFRQRHANDRIAKIYPVSGAGAAVVNGMESRARRVMYPRYIRALSLVRSAVPRVLERALKRRDVAWVVDRLEERDGVAGASAAKKLTLK